MPTKTVRLSRPRHKSFADVYIKDILARLSLYLLADPHPPFSSLLEPLFTPKTIPNTLVVILLDWGSPWYWLRQLRAWILLLKAALACLDNDCIDAMNGNMRAWTERRKGVSSENIPRDSSDANIVLPLGPGEWDDALGVPLCVVCQNAEKIEVLEREHGWKDDEFDFILLYLRSILLKHGASLIYTASSGPGSLQTLIRSSLDIHSLLHRNPFKHNLVDRDKILVPPAWDSWGKIRVLREGFDVEGVSQAWTLDVQPPSGTSNSANASAEPPSPTTEVKDSHVEPRQDQSSAVWSFEKKIENPHRYGDTALRLGGRDNDGIEVQCPPTQQFLTEQYKVLDILKAEDEAALKAAGLKSPGPGQIASSQSRDSHGTDGNQVNEHIGPVQFNMGGIQVDADDMLRSLKDRDATRTLSEEPASPSFGNGAEGEDGENEKLRNFFAGLMTRGVNSATQSPK